MRVVLPTPLPPDKTMKVGGDAVMARGVVVAALVFVASEPKHDGRVPREVRELLLNLRTDPLAIGGEGRIRNIGIPAHNHSLNPTPASEH